MTKSCQPDKSYSNCWKIGNFWSKIRSITSPLSSIESDLTPTPHPASVHSTPSPASGASSQSCQNSAACRGRKHSLGHQSQTASQSTSKIRSHRGSSERRFPSSLIPASRLDPLQVGSSLRDDFVFHTKHQKGCKSRILSSRLKSENLNVRPRWTVSELQ